MVEFSTIETTTIRKKEKGKVKYILIQKESGYNITKCDANISFETKGNFEFIDSSFNNKDGMNPKEITKTLDEQIKLYTTHIKELESEKIRIEDLRKEVSLDIIVKKK